jgi:16S rRNA (guanine527-N7)-methyltransferase
MMPCPRQHPSRKKTPRAVVDTVAMGDALKRHHRAESRGAMQIGSPEWNALIVRHAASFHLEVNAGHLAAFAGHATTLLDWNKRTNLTRIVSPESIAVRHFVDSLAVVPLLAGCETIIDLGSGGGFPGLVLAAMMPESEIVLVDSVRKKVSFLNHLIRARQHRRAVAVHARTTDLAAHPDYRKGFAAVVSRAMADFEETVLASAPFVSPNGLIAAMRGPRGDEEAGAFMSSPSRCAAEEILGGPIIATTNRIQLPEGHGERFIVVVDRG